MTIWPIAQITFKEGIRNRALYGIFLFAFLLFISIFLISDMIMQDVGKVAVDLSLSAVSLGGLLLVLFIGINLMAKDLDKRTIYMVLSRPISRERYIVGKFFGVMLLILTTILLLGFISILAIMLIKKMYPNYFGLVSISMVVQALFFTVLMLIVLSATSFLFSSFTSTSFITLVLTVLVYIIGHSLTDVKALVEAPQAVGIQVSSSTVRIVQIAYYVFPNLSFFDIKTQAAHGLAIPLATTIWLVLYGIIYTAICLSLAAFIFRKKEFA